MVEGSFDAAHALRGYDGPCENLHGHSWKVQVFLKGEKLNRLGIMTDFKEIKAKLKEALADFDHANLNELPIFKEKNPSCENLTRIIFERLKKEISALSKTTVWESDKTCASYWDK